MNSLLRLLFVVAVTYTLVSCVGNGGKNSGDTAINDLEMDSIVMQDSFPPSTKVEVSPMHEFDLKYRYFKNNEALQAEINRVILNGRLDNISGLSTQDIGRELYASIKREYQDTVSTAGDYEDYGASMLGHFYSLEVALEASSDKFVSLQWVESTHTGGAHGYTAVGLSSFDRERNQVITESDIFVEGYKEQLAQIIQTQLVQDYKVNTIEDLSTEGFFSPSDIEPNDNFLLTETGIRYCFNPYEISPYAMGHIYVNLTWDDVSEIIRPGSIIEQYI